MTNKNPIVSIQGEVDSFHYLAAQHLFGSAVETLHRERFREVFEDVQAKRADCAVVAIENSLVGSINEVYDLLRKDGLRITGELYMRISHNLIALPGVELANIQSIYSHPMALMQCETFLQGLPGVDVHERFDTAGSVAQIATTGDKTAAAIASRQAAQRHKMHLLATDIESDKHNYTRFIVLSPLGSVSVSALSNTKTSIILTTNHTPGALYSALGVFAKRGINLSKLQSRPIIGKGWHYYFYIDFEAGTQEARTQEALRELQDYAGEVTVLGSYVKGEVVE